MIRSWSRLATSSSRSSSAAAWASSAAARSSPAAASYRLGSKRVSKSSTSRRARSALETSAASTVVLGEGRAGLAQVLRDGAQDDDLAPGQARVEDERVEAVGLGLAAPHGAEGVLEQLAVGLAAGAGEVGQPVGAQPEVVDVDRHAVGAVDLVRALVDDLDAEVGEQRQDRGQRQRPAPVELEAALVAGAPGSW